MCDLDPRSEQGAAVQATIPMLLDALVVTLTNRRVYSDGHPRVAASLEHATKVLKGLLQAEGGTLSVGIADGCLFHDGKPLVVPSVSASRVIHPLGLIGAGGLKFTDEANAEGIAALVQLLRDPAKEGVETWSAANEWLRRRPSAGIEVLPPFRGVTGPAGSEFTAGGDLGPTVPGNDLAVAEIRQIELPLVLYQGLMEHLQDVMLCVLQGQTPDLSRGQAYVEAILRGLTEDPVTMMNLAYTEQYDAYTFGHSIRVCFLALNFARAQTNEESLLLRIGVAALLHDVGKARVPPEILWGRHILTPEERREMERHVVHGAEILLGEKRPDPLAVATAFGHHRTIDGKGYPLPRYRAPLSVGTRLVKICDVYEALTALRPYKPPVTPSHAYRIMFGMVNHFDQALLRRFIEVNGLYPTASRVRLASGEQARVLAQTADPGRPIVEFERSGQGEPIASGSRPPIDLTIGEGRALEIAEFMQIKVA